MAKKKYYAVRQGRKPGIYETWDECKQQVDGYKNAEYKSFTSLADANTFLKKGYETTLDLKGNPSVCTLFPEEKPELIAYVDGSYLNGSFSYGCVIFDGNNIKEYKRAFHNHPDSSMRNVAGELQGAMKAIDYAVKHDAGSIDIYYDYQGIESWANGSWQANKPGTKKYKAFVKEARKKCKITFHKVKGHSGDTWNERVDKLAKEALGIH